MNQQVLIDAGYDIVQTNDLFTVTNKRNGNLIYTDVPTIAHELFVRGFTLGNNKPARVVTKDPVEDVMHRAEEIIDETEEKLREANDIMKRVEEFNESIEDFANELDQLT